MAYAERRGDGERPWRVKYMTPTGERSQSGFESKKVALDWGRAQEAEVRARRWNDPRKGDITLDAWIKQWGASQDLAPTTTENYAYMIQRHILPVFGDTPLSALEPLEIDRWQREIRDRGFAPSVAAKARSVLGTILTDAVTAKRITSNPAVTRRRRGRQDIYAGAEAAESLWATPDQVLTIAERVGLLAGRPDEFVMVLLAAYTGMRFGEVRGLERRYARLGSVRVEWQLREVGGRFLKAPPKHNSRRTIPLPPFLADLLSEHLKSSARGQCACEEHRGDFVFRPAGGQHHGRSNFASRFFRPSADGRLVPKGEREQRPVMVDEAGRYVRRWRGESLDATARRAVASWCPVVPGLTPHDLRHSHKTWMIGDGVPEVAQFERLGHRLGGIRGVYSHVAPEVRTRLVDGLQARWEESLRRRAKMGPSGLPVLQELLESQIGPWRLSSQIPPIAGATILKMRNDQAV